MKPAALKFRVPGRAAPSKPVVRSLRIVAVPRHLHRTSSTGSDLVLTISVPQVKWIETGAVT